MLGYTKTNASLEIRNKYYGLVSGRNPAGYLETRIKEHRWQPEHFSRICSTNPVKMSKRISGTRQQQVELHPYKQATTVW